MQTARDGAYIAQQQWTAGEQLLLLGQGGCVEKREALLK